MTVCVGVVFARLLGVMRRVDEMPVGEMCVVTGLLMVPSFVVLGRCTMMMCRVFVMLCGLPVRWDHGTVNIGLQSVRPSMGSSPAKKAEVRHKDTKSAI